MAAHRGSPPTHPFSARPKGRAHLTMTEGHLQVIAKRHAMALLRACAEARSGTLSFSDAMFNIVKTSATGPILKDLTDAGLLEKTPDRVYRITEVGRQALKLGEAVITLSVSTDSTGPSSRGR
jgi:DNA-binding HxlR family transcriptional regulator